MAWLLTLSAGDGCPELTCTTIDGAPPGGGMIRTSNPFGETMVPGVADPGCEVSSTASSKKLERAAPSADFTPAKGARASALMNSFCARLRGVRVIRSSKPSGVTASVPKYTAPSRRTVTIHAFASSASGIGAAFLVTAISTLIPFRSVCPAASFAASALANNVRPTRHTSSMRFIAPPYSICSVESLLRFCPTQGRRCQRSSQPHGFDRGRRHDHHRAAFLNGFVQHVHGAQVQGHRIFLIRGCGLHEAVGDFLFRLAQNDARLPFALRLRLARHGILQALRNLHVANLDRLHRNSPGIRLFVENPLQLVPHRFALGDHLRQLVAA